MKARTKITQSTIPVFHHSSSPVHCLYTPDSSHELRDLQHCMSEQIDLHVFKAITAASCVDIIVNKRLNNYN